MSEVRRWRAGLGLERFAEAFEREQVTRLPELRLLSHFVGTGEVRRQFGLAV